MRQVPKYLVIGSGRMATHFCHYLSLLKLPFHQWSRRDDSILELNEFALDSSHILLLIKDSAITEFEKNYSFSQNKTFVHFSGCLSVNGVYGVHPLMTFSNALYEFNDYKLIPFILEENEFDFHDLLPGLSNQSFKIPKHFKNFYHALCVMSGNFTTILWKKFFKELNSTFNLPQEIAYPYLKQITNNIISDHESAITGPLVRKDMDTVEANLKALNDDPFKEVYEAFLKLFGGKLS